MLTVYLIVGEGNGRKAPSGHTEEWSQERRGREVPEAGKGGRRCHGVGIGSVLFTYFNFININCIQY